MNKSLWPVKISKRQFPFQTSPTMASEEHKRLASFIKSVHKTLRTASSDRAPEEVWAEHLAKEALLQEYARSMQELATEHWTDVTEESSRINWTRGQIISYFRAGGREHQHGRDFKFARKKGVNWEIPSQSQFRQRLRVLDVGSCYNPFTQFEEFGEDLFITNTKLNHPC